jgi:hypothetical protein
MRTPLARIRTLSLRGPGSSTAALAGDMVEGVYQDIKEQVGADYLDMQECRLELEGQVRA